MLGIFLCKAPETEFFAFLSSRGYLIGMLTSAAFGVYPLLLPSSNNPSFSLSIHNSAAERYGLSSGLVWWIPGMLLAAAYAVFTYGRISGKLELE